MEATPAKEGSQDKGRECGRERGRRSPEVLCRASPMRGGGLRDIETVVRVDPRLQDFLGRASGWW